jgi:hypothetical protein
MSRGRHREAEGRGDPVWKKFKKMPDLWIAASASPPRNDTRAVIARPEGPWRSRLCRAETTPAHGIVGKCLPTRGWIAASASSPRNDDANDSGLVET